MSTAIKSLAVPRQQGFALIEVALAVLIAASVFLATVQFLQISSNRAGAERMGQDINEIFNAGITYYQANNGNWPDSIQTLITNNLLPTSALKDSWGYQYHVDSVTNVGWTIGVCVPTSIADNLTALLPFGKIQDSDTAHCGIVSDSVKYVTTTINQVANNQKENPPVMVQSGDKVAAPSCPLVAGQQYVPRIFLLPAAFDAGGHVISAMSAYADALDTTDDPTDYPNGYWTVHLDLTTDQGTVEDNKDNTLNSDPAAMVAFTACFPPN